MKKPTVKMSVDQELIADLPTAETFADLPHLEDVLDSGTWEDGEAKGDRALLVFVSRAGSVRGFVKVQLPPLKLMALGRSIDECLRSLDLLLASDDTPWEHDQEQADRNKKRK